MGKTKQELFLEILAKWVAIETVVNVSDEKELENIHREFEEYIKSWGEAER